MSGRLPGAGVEVSRTAGPFPTVPPPAVTFEPPIGDSGAPDYKPNKVQPISGALAGNQEDPGLIGGLLGAGIAVLASISGAISAVLQGRQSQLSPRTRGSERGPTGLATGNPPIGALIGIGVLLTLATLVVEAGFIYAEAALAAPSLTGNPFAIVGELVLVSLSLFLINFEVAYWAYVYRVMGARPGEKVHLKLAPFD